MVIGDGPTSGTGFGEELRNVFFRLVQTGEFEITWFSLSDLTFPRMLSDDIFPDIPHKGAKIRVVGNRGDPMAFGANTFPKHYLTYNPDAVFFMGDPTNIAGYIEAPYFWKEKFHFPFYMYVTLDGLPLHPSWTKWLSHVNVLVAMTDWAQMEYVKAGFQPASIHHGVNWNWWSNNKKTKAKLRAKYGIPEDCTLFVSWDVNQYRKRTDALIRCWRDFHPETKNAKLLLYTDWNLGGSMGWNIEGLISQYKVPRQNIISPIQIQGAPKYWSSAETPEQLKKIVCMGDIMLSTTSGEGFGKTGLEAMAMNLPAIITDYSACSEVHQKGSVLVPTYRGRAGRYRMDDRRRSVEAGVVDEKKFVDAMIYLYENEGERRKLGREARRWSKEFDYDKKIIPQWIKLLGNLDTDLIAAKELLNI